MIKRTPKVAADRQEAAWEKYEFKVKKLEELITEGTMDLYAGAPSVAAFTKWIDVSLKVEAVGEKYPYHKDVGGGDKYGQLLNRLCVALKKIKATRKKSVTKATKQTALMDENNSLKGQLQSYVNQNAVLFAENTDLRNANQSLRGKNSRQAKQLAKISPLAAVVSIK